MTTFYATVESISTVHLVTVLASSVRQFTEITLIYSATRGPRGGIPLPRKHETYLLDIGPVRKKGTDLKFLIHLLSVPQRRRRREVGGGKGEGGGGGGGGGEGEGEGGKREGGERRVVDGERARGPFVPHGEYTSMLHVAWVPNTLGPPIKEENFSLALGLRIDNAIITVFERERKWKKKREWEN
uniref:Uncharacterized protein n=1 Tax=Vespula pensylvanica TaxID=30213 RepID=A0A834NXT9_VESPE|nr:hypothetical protein H0235_010476 [Vespula pensylvanica]